MAPTLYDALRTGGLSAGDVVVSKAGHDGGRAFVVLAVEPPYARLADGGTRPWARPKRKRLKHVRPVGRIPDAEAALGRIGAIRDGPAREAAVRRLLEEFLRDGETKEKERAEDGPERG